jgi:hypothetical protein
VLDEPVLDEPTVVTPVLAKPGPVEPAASSTVVREPPAPEPAPARQVPEPEAEPRQPYETVRRGWAGWVAVGVALVSAALIFVLGALGELAGEPLRTAGLGVVGVLAALFAYRRIGRTSRVHLAEDGTLSLTFGPHHHTFSLADHATVLEMRGQPGNRDWAVDLSRPDASRLTVTSASVDPPRFTEALRQWRPDL